MQDGHACRSRMRTQMQNAEVSGQAQIREIHALMEHEDGARRVSKGERGLIRAYRKDDGVESGADHASNPAAPGQRRRCASALINRRKYRERVRMRIGDGITWVASLTYTYVSFRTVSKNGNFRSPGARGSGAAGNQSDASD